MKGKLILSVADGADRDKWLAVRKQGVGGSDAAVVVGLNKWKSPYQLWLDKTNQVEAEDLSDNEAVYWGTVLEDLVAKRFEEVTGKKVRRCGTLQDEEFPYMLANIDRLVVGEEAGLEIKTANGFKSKEWEGDEVPAQYILQCQWYMGITGLKKWYIACLIGGQKFVYKEILRQDGDIEALRAAVSSFWEINVKGMVPPELDGSEGTTEALGKVYDNPTDAAVDLPSAAAAAIEVLDQIAATEKILAEQKAQAQNTLKALLGNFEVGMYNDRKVSWKATKPRVSIDSKKLQANYPDAYAACMKVGKASRMFKLN